MARGYRVLSRDISFRQLRLSRRNRCHVTDCSGRGGAAHPPEGTILPKGVRSGVGSREDRGAMVGSSQTLGDATNRPLS